MRILKILSDLLLVFGAAVGIGTIGFLLYHFLINGVELDEDLVMVVIISGCACLTGWFIGSIISE